MRTFCRPRPRLLFSLCLLALLGGAEGLARAQTLARPGWAGANASLEPWWHRAVFYRIQPALFQDSNGDGQGDLQGIVQRLGYLQTLGVDAIVLAPPFEADAFDDLARAASADHIRVLVQIGAPAAPPNDLDATYLAAARSWLTQGAAGLLVDTPALAAATGDERAARLLRDLRGLTNAFPGERVLLAAAPGADHAALAKPLAQYAQLAAAPAITATALKAAPLRAQLIAALGTAGGPKQPSPYANPLLCAATPELPAEATAAQQATVEATLAALMLGSRTAVLLDAGQEIGLRPLADGAVPVMQWTPSNVTPKPPEPAPEAAAPAPAAIPAPEPAAPADPNSYGAFKPYVPPPPPPKPKPKVNAEEAAPPVDPNSLPGFTAGELPAGHAEDAAVAATINVASEDADANSLLNLYRKLIQYHHGNATLHNGTEYVLDHDTLNAVTFLRRAPSGAGRAPTILAVANLSDKPLALSLTDDLKRLQLRPGAFRTLITSSAKPIAPQSYDHLSLPPYTVFLGELYH